MHPRPRTLVHAHMHLRTRTRTHEGVVSDLSPPRRDRTVAPSVRLQSMPTASRSPRSSRPHDTRKALSPIPISLSLRHNTHPFAAPRLPRLDARRATTPASPIAHTAVPCHRLLPTAPAIVPYHCLLPTAPAIVPYHRPVPPSHAARSKPSPGAPLRCMLLRAFFNVFFLFCSSSLLVSFLSSCSLQTPRDRSLSHSF